MERSKTYPENVCLFLNGKRLVNHLFVFFILAMILLLLPSCSSNPSTSRKYEEDGIVYEKTSEHIDDADFVKKGVATIYLTLGSGSIRPKVTDIQYSKNKESVNIVFDDANHTKVGTDDMAYWIIKVPVEKSVKSVTYEWKQ